MNARHEHLDRGHANTLLDPLDLSINSWALHAQFKSWPLFNYILFTLTVAPSIWLFMYLFIYLVISVGYTLCNQINLLTALNYICSSPCS